MPHLRGRLQAACRILPLTQSSCSETYYRYYRHTITILRSYIQFYDSNYVQFYDSAMPLCLAGIQSFGYALRGEVSRFTSVDASCGGVLGTEG